MRKFAYYATLPYVVVLNGVIMDLPGLLGSFVRLFGIPALLLWLLSLLRSTGLRKLQPFHWLLLAFLIWNGCTSFWSVDSDSTLFWTYRYVLMFGMTVMLWDMYRTKSQVESGLQAMVIGGYVLAIGTAVNFMLGNKFYSGRYSALGFHPNDVGKIFAISIPFAWYMAYSNVKRNNFLRLLNFAYPLVTTVALILSGSRGALVACIPAYLYLLWSFCRLSIWLKSLFSIVLVVACIGISQMDLTPQLNRLSTTLESASGDKLTGRLDIWEAGWDVFSKHPILGIGAGAFPEATRNYNVMKDQGEPLPAHNTYLSVLTETGVIGFVIFMLILATVIRALLLFPKAVREVWAASFIAWAVGVAATTWELRGQTWLLLVMIITGSACAEYQAQREAPPLPPPPDREAVPLTLARSRV